MKIKLTNQEVSILEVSILDQNISKISTSIKSKFLYSNNEEQKLVVDLTKDEYLFLLELIENEMIDEMSSIYHNLIMQDTQDIIEPYHISVSLI
jgi:hypothetical protein